MRKKTHFQEYGFTLHPPTERLLRVSEALKSWKKIEPFWAAGKRLCCLFVYLYKMCRIFVCLCVTRLGSVKSKQTQVWMVIPLALSFCMIGHLTDFEINKELIQKKVCILHRKEAGVLLSLNYGENGKLYNL